MQHYPMPHAIKRKKHAFSLIELLVSVAVMAILLSIVIATTSNVRSKAIQTDSVSNIRNIGAAISLYVMDNDGLLPGPTVVTLYPQVQKPPAKTWTLSWYLLNYLDTAPVDSDNNRVRIHAFGSRVLTDRAEAAYQAYGGVRTDTSGGDFQSVNRNVGYRFGLANWSGSISRHPQALSSLDDANWSCGWLTQTDNESKQIFNSTSRLWLFPDGSVETRPADQFPAFKNGQEHFSKLIN